MNDLVKIAIIVLIASVIGGFVAGLVGDNQSDDLGAGTRFPNGISADTTSPSAAGNIRGGTFTLTGAATIGSTLAVTGVPTFTADAVFNGGDGAIVVTTTNTATSSIEVGCIQMYATSTATALRFEFNPISATTTINGTSDGMVAWSYGSCPI